MLQPLILITGCIVAFCIVLDYLLPGTKVTENITGKYIESNQRYAGRYNTSAYKLLTQSRDFYVDKNFFINVQQGDTIVLNLSPVFNAINSYQCTRYSQQAETFSLRFTSGLLLPLAMFLVTLIHIRIKTAPVPLLIFVSFVLNCITLLILLL